MVDALRRSGVRVASCDASAGRRTRGLPARRRGRGNGQGRRRTASAVSSRSCRRRCCYRCRDRWRPSSVSVSPPL
ncbi:RNA methyltransferase, TrmH family [Burkholderia pseudomallei 305]|nr:RNA methyltransferase, TrmH family [Burkholderia pseudomallei 305]